jgi:hypothetical protein
MTQDVDSRRVVPRFLDIGGASAYLAISKWSLYRMVENRRIPFIPLSPSAQPGRSAKKPMIRFDRVALDGWMEKKAIRPVG